MADNQSQLDTAIQAVSAEVTKLGNDLTAAITALEAKISSANSPVDFTPEVTSLQNVATTLTSLDASANEANPPAAAAIIANPANLTITGGANATGTFSVSEAANAAATFTAVSSDTTIANVSPGSAAGSFVVTEVAAGTATITVSDNAATPNTATVAVTLS